MTVSGSRSGAPVASPEAARRSSNDPAANSCFLAIGQLHPVFDRAENSAYLDRGVARRCALHVPDRLAFGCRPRIKVALCDEAGKEQLADVSGEFLESF